MLEDLNDNNLEEGGFVASTLPNSWLKTQMRLL